MKTSNGLQNCVESLPNSTQLEHKIQLHLDQSYNLIFL